MRNASGNGIDYKVKTTHTSTDYGIKRDEEASFEGAVISDPDWMVEAAEKHGLITSHEAADFFREIDDDKFNEDNFFETHGKDLIALDFYND